MAHLHSTLCVLLLFHSIARHATLSTAKAGSQPCKTIDRRNRDARACQGRMSWQFIHSLSHGNHTIPLLDKFALEMETTIVIPDERVLRDEPDSGFKASGNALAYQFLEGVLFMHENKVAHLDLKPDTILVTITISH